jgi:1-acyl-sn-glycerol-3-phosphate acyltransferase
MDPATSPRERPFHDGGYGYDVFGLHLPAVDEATHATRFLYERYFRVSSSGIEQVPDFGPAILIANHSGVLPIDAALLFLDVVRKSPRIPRMIADHFVPKLPLLSTLFARVGVVSGTRANVRHLLEHDELLAIFPEGVTGPAKRFRDRYRLQSWRVGFAELAIRHRAPVVPVAIVGAEESWPLAGKLDVHVFGSPYVPVPATPLPLPAHVHLRYGAPLILGASAGDADDPHAVEAAAALVRERLGVLVDDVRTARRGIFR